MFFNKTFDRQSLGRLGEQQALQYLQKQSYRLMQKNYTCPIGEIDLIMQHKDCICFIEVKSAFKFKDSALAHYNIVKQKKQIRLAQHYLMYNQHLQDKAMRFDLVLYIYTGPDQGLFHYTHCLSLN